MMNIPKSSIEPFGVLGFPTVNTELDCVGDIQDAIHRVVSSPSLNHLNPVMMGVLLRNIAIKTGAHSVKSPRKSCRNVTIFNVTFTLVPNGRQYHAYPSYVQHDYS